MSEQEIPYGYCHCGCGQKTNIAKRNFHSRGIVKGEPWRYAPGHTGLNAPLSVRFWKYLAPGAFNECWLWQGCTNPGGYGVIQAGRAQRTIFLAHRVSWELHNGPIPNGLDCLHECDNPPCCNPHHLFLGDDAANMADKIMKGRHPRGESCSYAKLTEDQVKEIRTLSAQGVERTEIAKRFGINRSHVRDIANRKIWKHIP